MFSRAKRSGFAIHKMHDGHVLYLALLLVLWANGSAGAEDQADNLDAKQELKLVDQKRENENVNWLNQKIQPIFGKKVRLNGQIESNYEYLDVRDIGDEESGSSSDFFISTAKLTLRVYPNNWSRVRVKVDAVDIGRNGEEGRVRLDEAILTLKSLQIPLYAIGGKTEMPFGVFEDRLIEGTLTEDLYEIDEWGVIFGWNPDFYGLDISFSVYRDPKVIGNLQDFDTHEYRLERTKEDRFRSYITNVTLEPIEDILTLSTFYNSEPGDGSRNQSIGGALTLEYGKFILDAEYITALKRERGENEEENLESAGLVGLAFNVLESLQLATRYEVFRDDTSGDQDEVLDYRAIAGFNYTLLDWLNFSFLDDATISFEYRYSKFEKEPDSPAANSQNMLQFQLDLKF